MEFRLVIPGKLEDWLGGYAAGSIPAHFIHYKRYGKVFWYCNIFRKGFGVYKQYVDSHWDSLRRNPTRSDGNPVVSDVGYFYETGRNVVSWQFALEGIFREIELAKHQKDSYIPSFREVYLGEADFDGVSYWILISELRKFKRPRKFIDGISFGCLRPNSRVPQSPRPTDIRNNCFVTEFPDLRESDLYEPTTKELLDTHMKELLRYGRKDRFREENVHRAFFHKLLSEGIVFARESIDRSNTI